MDYTLERMAQNELGAGERLLWVGQPNPWRSTLTSFAIYLFAIPWTAFVIFWEAMALGMGSHVRNQSGPFLIFPLFGIPFVLIGLGMLSTPIWVYRKMRRTLYAVTDKRLLIIISGRSRTVQSYDERSIGDIQRREYTDGSGDIIFARKLRYGTDDNGTTTTSTTNIGFLGIPDVRSVEKLVRDIARSPALP
jgi:hypothetical protein